MGMGRRDIFTSAPEVAGLKAFETDLGDHLTNYRGASMPGRDEGGRARRKMCICSCGYDYGKLRRPEKSTLEAVFKKISRDRSFTDVTSQG